MNRTRLSAGLFTLAAVLVLVGPARAQSLVVATNTFETGVQTYTYGLITNGATYTVGGAGASVLATNLPFYVGTNGTGRSGNLVVTNGATFTALGTNQLPVYVVNDNAGTTSSLLVSGATFTNGNNLGIGGSGGYSAGAVALVANDGARVFVGGVSLDSSTRAILDISGGTLLVSTNFIRGSVNVKTHQSTINISGSNTRVFVSAPTASSGYLFAGGFGSAVLNITAGALVTNSGGSRVGAPNVASQGTGANEGSATGLLYMASGAVWSNGTVTGYGGLALGGKWDGTGGAGVGIGLVTDPGTLLFAQGVITVGGSGTTYRSSLTISNRATVATASALQVSQGRVLITDGGILEVASGIQTTNIGILASVSNVGGVYQFTDWNPNITTNNGGPIVFQNGGVSYRNSPTAPHVVMDTRLTNMVFLGTNWFQLNNCSNAITAFYNFSAGYGPTNWSELRLTGARSAWRGTGLVIDGSGGMLVSNTTARVTAAVTNLGSVRVVNSVVSYAAPVVVSGSYFSDPSTNTFDDTVTVTASGSLYGSNGDLFAFNRDLVNQSTNRSSFDLSHAVVLFTNGTGVTAHNLILSNSGSVNMGQGWTNFAQVATNFGIGQLSIAAGNRLTIAGNKDSITNALYLGWLDIQGINTNGYANVTNGLFAALNLPNINVYYDKYDARNDWLNANLINDSVAGFNLWGGGLLLPIPEPSALATIAAGVGLLAFLRRRK